MRAHPWCSRSRLGSVARFFAPALLVVVALAGCGNRHLVLQVDVLSYLDPALTHVEFGPIPAVPGGIYTGEQEIVKDCVVNLVDGTSSITDVQDVSISMLAVATDSTGAGADTLRLYLSDPNTDPLWTTPAVVLPITLTPGVIDSVGIDLGTDSRVADLFTGKTLRVTLTTTLRGPSSGAPLNAKVRVASLDAVLLAGRRPQL